MRPAATASALTTAAADGARLEELTTAEALLAVRDEWDALVAAMPRPSPFLLAGWLDAWWRHCGAGQRLALHVARRDGRLVGALPLVVRRRAGVRIASFAGGRHAALADLLLAPGEDPATAAALAGAASAGWDLLDVFGLPADSRLEAALGPGVLRVTPRIEAPVLDLEGGWEAVYAAKTSTKRRSLHRRRRRQLGDLGAVTTTVARSPDEVEAALPEMLRLHALRRADRPDGSGMSTRAGAAFHRDGLLALAGSDVTRIVALRLDGRAVAYHCYLAFGGAMVVHSLGFDPEHGRLSPGQVATLDAIAAASEEGLARVEFLGGDERYKLELADRFEPLHSGLATSGTVRGRVAGALTTATLAAHARARRSDALRRLYVEGLAPLHRLRRRRRG